jgi:glycosyltransferase involved in cell wall biosynthesis
LPEKILHIISLEVPYPLLHGGRYDLYYKLTALWEEGIGIHLHCFGTRNSDHHQLEKFCISISYYPRTEGWKGFSFSIPYIVNSRRSKALIENLLKDNYPVLMEGIHCTFILNHPEFSKRKMILRLHNVESVYYEKLFQASSSVTRKCYYKIESVLLRRYEKQVAQKVSLILAVSDQDASEYEHSFGAQQIQTLPVFIRFTAAGYSGKPEYKCLYHGNLAIPENEAAVRFLLTEVFVNTDIPLVVAGRNPSPKLRSWLSNYPAVTLVANPTEEQLEQLLSKASVNILPSFNATGVKIKLMHALYSGRQCITNTQGIRGSGLDKWCIVLDDPSDLLTKIIHSIESPIGEDVLQARRKELDRFFDPTENARNLIQLIW